MYTFLHRNIQMLFGIIRFFLFYLQSRSHMYDTANLFLHLGTIQKLILGRPQGSLGAVKNYTAF